MTGLVFPALAVVCASLELLALRRGSRRLEYVAKPAVMVCLWIWLYTATGLQGAAFWFGAAVLCSLAGDVLLLWPERFFVAGLTAFLAAHGAYLIGFSMPLPPVSVWSLTLAVIVGLSAGRLLQRILAAVRAKRHRKLTVPVAVYGAIVTLMLMAALLTLSNTAWDADASALVSLGAVLFFASDVLLAWNRFVAPIPGERMLNIGIYHAGQILLIAGVVLQFS